MFGCLSLSLSVHLSAVLVHLLVARSFCPSVSLCVFPFVCLSLCVCLRPSDIASAVVVATAVAINPYCG